MFVVDVFLNEGYAFQYIPIVTRPITVLVVAETLTATCIFISSSSRTEKTISSEQEENKKERGRLRRR